MKYLTHQRFKCKSISGNVNIPAMSECECDGNIITYNGKPVCYATSYNGQQYFARNDDGNGMERGRLTQAILKKLAEHDEDEVQAANMMEVPEEERPVTEYQKRWDKVWEDHVCRLFKKDGDEDMWQWNDTFYKADIDSLRYIAALVGAKIQEV